jgi:class 3 adenylate cyclase/tetratricopeptide (TPR) repeat protein
MERKLATVLFVDLVDSTSLVTSADPEVVRRRVSQYFELAESCIERHGGTVEKFVGDAVMAAFGVPTAHEDDAARAVRSALTILSGVSDLGLQARAGVESGEVLVDSAESTFVTGEAVNVAARLQQSAAPGSVAIGPGTRRLTLSDFEVEDAGAVEVRGRGEVWSWRVVCESEMRRRPQARFVGRGVELGLLRNLYERAVRDRRAHLVTVFGEAGVGKSRLVTEFTEGVERATILTGRALSYGEGVAYWPIASMIKASAGITDDDPAAEAFEKLRVSCESDAVADLLAVALGVLGAAETATGGGDEQIAWAALRWSEQLADAQPLVLVFEDVQWADERLLELIEHLSRSLERSPALVVCVARNELLDVKPDWGGGNRRAAAIELAPLSPDESRELVDELLAPEEAAPAMRARVLERADGNPLFLEETARVLVEGDGAGVPDTLQTLISARIDLLPAQARSVLQAAAVVGRVFWRGAVAHLLPDAQIEDAIETLCRRDLIVDEERSAIPGDRAYRFSHVLIRDVAYTIVTKTERALLHRRFADWVATRHEDHAAIRAYHLDRAALYVQELEGAVDAELSAEAAAALETAGAQALESNSFSRARRLLSRAVELECNPHRQFLAASAAVELGDLGAVAVEMAAVRDTAREHDDAFLHGRALNALALVALARDGDAHESQRLAEEALATLPPDDVEGRAATLFRLATAAWWPGEVRRAEAFVRQVLDLVEEHGRRDLRGRALRSLAWLLEVRLELDDAAALILALDPPGEDVLERARTANATASLLRLQGRLPEAAAAFREARALYLDMGLQNDAAWTDLMLGWIAYVGDDLDGAEGSFREALRVFVSNEDHGRLCEAERALAEVLVERDRLPQAERLALAACERVSHQDLTSSTSTLRTLALVRAAQGRDDEAEALLRESLALVEGTDCGLLEVGTLVPFARFLRARGRDEEADVLESRLPHRTPGWLNDADRAAEPVAAARSDLRHTS